MSNVSCKAEDAKPSLCRRSINWPMTEGRDREWRGDSPCGMLFDMSKAGAGEMKREDCWKQPTKNSPATCGLYGRGKEEAHETRGDLERIFEPRWRNHFREEKTK